MKVIADPEKVELNLKRNSAPATTPAARSLPRILRHSWPALLAFVFVSCASIDATTMQYAGAPHYPPSSPASVVILRTTPTRANDRLGEVVVDASTDPAPQVSEVEQKLREEAAKMGADAAVVVYDRLQPVGMYVTGGWWNQSVQTITGRKLVGVAIKYKP